MLDTLLGNDDYGGMRVWDGLAYGLIATDKLMDLTIDGSRLLIPGP